jgi:hypothetical protein
VFVRDATRSIMLNKYPFDVVPGDVLNGRVVGSYKEDSQWMTLNPLADIDQTGTVQITHGDLPEPDVATFDDLDSHHIMDYIKMQGVTLDYRTMKNKVRLAIVDGERPIALNSTYLGLNIDLPSETEVQGNRYDVEAIISYYNIPGYDDSFLLTAPVTLFQNSGINPLLASPQGNAAIYNLQGQRVAVSSSSTVLPRGVYIVNGKKYIAK